MALKLGYVLSNFLLDINGVGCGMVSSFTAPDSTLDEIKGSHGSGEETEIALGHISFGKGKFTQHFAHASAVYDVIRSVMDKSCTEFQAKVTLANQDYVAQREVVMENCYFESLSFSDLKANDGKKMFDYTLEFSCENVIHQAASGKITAPIGKNLRNWNCGNFHVSGLPFKADDMCTSLSLPKFTAKLAREALGQHILPTIHYANWETAGLKLEFSSTAYAPLLGFYNKIFKDRMFTDEEAFSFGVDLKDTSMKKTQGTFTFDRCAPKKITFMGEAKVGESMANPSIEIAVQKTTMKLDAKA